MVVLSPSIEIDVPSIIMLRRFHKFQNYVKFSRSNIFKRHVNVNIVQMFLKEAI